MADLKISVPADLREALDKKLGSGSAQGIAPAAFAEWASWLLATARPVSMSEMEIERVFTLYNEVLTEELPSASHLSGLLQLPIARCRYIVQAISYQHPQLMQQRRLAIVKKAFDAVTQHGDIYVMDVEPECRQAVDDILSEIADSSGLAELRGRRHGNLVRYELTPGYYQRLGKAIEGQLAALKGGGP